MATNPYDMLFSDNNPNRQFVIQPYTTNGPSNPTGGIDPAAAAANTTLYLYGKGSPNYGERIQEDMLHVMEHFNNPVEPSFPIPGQVWSNTSVSPPQLFVYNPYKYTVVFSSGNVIGIQSTGGLDSLATVLARFTALGTSKAFALFSPTFVPHVFTQQTTPGYPQISGGMVLLSVTPSSGLAGAMVGFTTGGWEDIFQSNCVNTLRTSFNANGQFLINVPDPTLPQHAATKAYVDTAVTGGTIMLSNLGDVQFATPGFPQTNSVLYYNGTKWTDKLVPTLPFVPTAGGTMTGLLNLSADPLLPLQAATKQYVDAQPLSGVFTVITAPANNDLLAYDSGTLKWINKGAYAAGVLPLIGGPMLGPINMSGFGISNLPSPVAPADAATKAYVDSVAGGNYVTNASYFDNVLGTLNIVQSSAPSVVISGFLYNIEAEDVYYTPPDTSKLGEVPGMFFQSTLADNGINDPNDIENPTYIKSSVAFGQLDQSLGNFAEPRQRLAFVAPGGLTAFNISTGSPLSVLTAPNMEYVKGSGNLQLYVNGVKQIQADCGKYAIAGVNTTTALTGITFGVGTDTLTIPGNALNVIRKGNIITISGTSTVNDGSYRVTASTFVGPDTDVTVVPNLFSATPGTTPFVASGVGTLTYGPYGILPGMPTGYVLGGPSNLQSLLVIVNAFAAVTVTIDTAITDCRNFGLLSDAINTVAASHYINPIVGVTSGAFGSFVIDGDRTTQFPTGTGFTVRYASGNSGSYTVGPGSPTFALGQTTIPITTTIPTGAVDGVIFQDNWGFSTAIENGTIVFYSNVAGIGSAVVPTDAGLFAGITGTYWPVTITTPLTGTTNVLAPNDFSYKEIGLYGCQSSLFEFNVAPTNVDVVEVIIDREVIYKKFNPLATAVTA